MNRYFYGKMSINLMIYYFYERKQDRCPCHQNQTTNRSYFLRMLAEMPFEKLTTTLLIKECLISKGTFYAHYLDKYDLAEQLIDRELQLFETLLTQRFENKQTSLEQLSQMVTKHFLLKFTLNILYLLGYTADRK